MARKEEWEFPNLKHQEDVASLLRQFGLVVEFQEWGRYDIFSEDDEPLGFFVLDDDETFYTIRPNEVLFYYNFKMPNTGISIKKRSILRHGLMFPIEMNRLKEQLIQATTMSKKSNPASSLSSIAIAGLAGYFLGKK